MSRKDYNSKAGTNEFNRKETIAYEAARQIDSLLTNKEVYLSKPWQLKNHLPQSVTYKSTYEEIFLIAPERASVRPHFVLNDESVTIPVIFAKINGITSDQKSYWSQLHSLLLLPHTFLIKQFPFQPYISESFKSDYLQLLNSDGTIHIDRLLTSSIWTYNYLPINVQKSIANSIKLICAEQGLKKYASEGDIDVQLFLFTNSLRIPPPILKMIQKYDYGKQVPKIILYNNNLHGQIARSDASLLLLLNKIGFDIFIFNPAGNYDLENYIDENVYDRHQLESIALDLQWRDLSLLKRLFKAYK